MTPTRSNVAPEEAGEMQRAQLLRKGGRVATGGRGRGEPGLLLQQSVEGGRGARPAESWIRTFYVQGAFAQAAHISLGREDPGVTFPEL